MNEGIRQQYELSLYKELYHLGGSGKTLVIHELTNTLYVKKQRTVYDRSVYDWLLAHDNPHIPRMIGVYEEKTETGSVLTVLEEYIQGKTLAQMLENEALSNEEKLRIFTQICDGLLFLHTAVPPIIHRDIKADNILIDGTGCVKIIDYDAAKMYHKGKTRDTVLIGTEGSAAPEQYGFRQSDARTDVYAAGVLLKHMFPDDMQMLQIADKATQMDPDRRYQSVEELKQKCCGTRRWYRYIPGLRTMKLRNILIAAAGYVLMIYIAAEMKVERVRGPGDLLLNRLTFFVVEFCLLLLFAYRRKIGKRFKLLQSENRTLRVLGYCIAVVVITVIPLFVLAWIEIFLYGPVK